MGRPRKYHTQEEKLAANRAKSKRYFDKHKPTIHAQRSVKYRERSKRAFIFLNPTSAPADVEKGTKERERPTPDCVSYWCERTERVAMKLNDMLQNSPTQFLDTIVSKYLISYQKDDIRDPILDVTQLQRSIHRYQNEILQLTGAGKEWARSEEVAKAVTNTVKALEELLCAAMDGPEALRFLHERCELSYQ